MKQTEVPTLRREGTEGVVEADFVKESQVTKETEEMRVTEVIGGRDYEKYLRALLVDGRLHRYTCEIF